MIIRIFAAAFAAGIVLLTAVSSLQASAPAPLQPSLETIVQISSQGSNIVFRDTTSATLSSLYDDGGGAGGSVASYASYGLLRAKAHGVALTGDPGVAAGATARWIDHVTIDAAGKTGQQGTLTASMSVSGTGGAVESSVIPPLFAASADFTAGLLINGSPNSRNGNWSSQDDGTTIFLGVTPTGIVTVTASFTFGTPFTLNANLLTHGSASAATDVAGNASGGANLFDTLLWQGISNVRDESGAHLTGTGYSLRSDSGTDWRVPATPEPASAILLLAGAVLALVRGRRDRIGARG